MTTSIASSGSCVQSGSTRVFPRMAPRRRTRLPQCLVSPVALALLMASALDSAAAADFSVRTFESATRDQFWRNSGGKSKHFENASRFNQDNVGYGIEFQADSTRYLVLGEYRNSVHKHTRYIGGAWMPVQYGAFKLGAIAGMADGYPKMRNGGMFPIVLPVLSVESKNVGANFVVMPSVAGKVSGCVALQIKFRYM